MGSDGSKGLKAIKDRNGIAVVQDPKFSKFNGMPQSAINMVKVDIIAPADELPKKIISFLNINKVKLSKVVKGVILRYSAQFQGFQNKSAFYFLRHFEES